MTARQVNDVESEGAITEVEPTFQPDPFAVWSFGLAGLSFVIGFGSLVGAVLIPVTGLGCGAAIPLSLIGLTRISRRPAGRGRRNGTGIAIVGLMVGILGFAVVVGVVANVVLSPNS